MLNTMEGVFWSLPFSTLGAKGTGEIRATA